MRRISIKVTLVCLVSGALLGLLVRPHHARLRIYPQFGQPLQDLFAHPAQSWIGVVPPLVVKYIVDESRRQVIVSYPIKPLRLGVVMFAPSGRLLSVS